MQNVFHFLRNFLQFLKIIIVFCMLMLLLYWTSNLGHFNWKWLGFITPILDIFIDMGENISDGSMMLFAAVFEYKYFWALAIMTLIFYILQFSIKGAEHLEDILDDKYRIYKKNVEQKFNAELQKEQANEQAAIKKYRVYVSASVKKNVLQLGTKVDLDEQNKLMNKFLTEKLTVSPTEYESGFLYSFKDFVGIDNVLDVFFKLLKSKAPLDYIICVQICKGDTINEKAQLKSLIDLKFENKISMMSDVAFRYKFNKTHRYGTSQLGMFQKNNDTVEVYEFIEI